MKKFILVVLSVVLGIGAMNAQTLTASKLLDNVSLTVKGGVTTPLQTPIENFKGVAGLELRKQVTPIFAVGVEGDWTANTSKWEKWDANTWIVDHQYVGAFAATNMSNLFGGYKGHPRIVEFETVVGIGWLHTYNKELDDLNSIGAKTGLNVNFNLGKARAWTLGLKPAIVWAIAPFNSANAALQVQAGLTYHFKNSNGKHHFTVCDKVATQSEVDALNDKINALRAALETCQNQPIKVEVREVVKEVVVRETVKDLAELPKIQFVQGSMKVSPTSTVTLQAIAEQMKDNPKLKYVLTGYASEEGNAEYNQKLSLSRAEAVKNALVKAGVDAAQLVTVGKGETTQFGDEWELNRVVVATME